MKSLAQHWGSPFKVINDGGLPEEFIAIARKMVFDCDKSSVYEVFSYLIAKSSNPADSTFNNKLLGPITPPDPSEIGPFQRGKTDRFILSY